MIVSAYTSGGVNGVEGDVDDPGQYEGAPANPQQFVAECCSQDLSVAVFVEQVEALGVVQPDQGDHTERNSSIKRCRVMEIFI